MPDFLKNMSNIGKKAIKIEEGVTVNQDGEKVFVSGQKGALETNIPSGILVNIGEGKIIVKKEREDVNLEKYLGLTRALVANAITGVSKGFEKKLELNGVGYRAKIEGTDLVLNVGFAVPVKIKSPEGINFAVDENVITVSGINKQFVGDAADNIRRVRPPDPYKGKGIKYVGEKLRRKAGKAAKAVGTATK